MQNSYLLLLAPKHFWRLGTFFRPRLFPIFDLLYILSLNKNKTSFLFFFNKYRDFFKIYSKQPFKKIKSIEKETKEV